MIKHESFCLGLCLLLLLAGMCGCQSTSSVRRIRAYNTYPGFEADGSAKLLFRPKDVTISGINNIRLNFHAYHHMDTIELSLRPGMHTVYAVRLNNNKTHDRVDSIQYLQYTDPDAHTLGIIMVLFMAVADSSEKIVLSADQDSVYWVRDKSGKIIIEKVDSYDK